MNMSSTNTVGNVAEYLRMVSQGREDRSVAGHILQNGRLFESAQLEGPEVALADLIDWDRAEEKQCWYNCQMEAMTLPPVPGAELRYVEGYVEAGRGFPTEHAWLSVNGKVLDPTLRTNRDTGRVRGLIPPGWEYYGVEMPTEVCAHILMHGASISIIDDYECGWPMIPGLNVKARRREARKTA